MNDTFTAVFEVQVYRENVDTDTVECIYREWYIIDDEWSDDAHDRADSRAFCLNRTYNGDFTFADRVIYVDHN